jgi:hypothetical protein
VYTRNFSAGAIVAFDTKTNRDHFQWSGSGNDSGCDHGN